MADDSPPHWDENTSQSYLDYGNYFVPAREQQMHMMVELLTGIPQPGRVLELCCGEGSFAELLLDTFPQVSYFGLDGSALMLEKAGQRLSRFGSRAKLGTFELSGHTWRKLDAHQQAVVSSLAIHHLDGEAKKQLFTDVYSLLAHGGVFIIADMVEPVTTAGRQVAANAWDGVVRERSIQLDGSIAGLEFFVRERWNTYRYPDPDDIDHPSPLFDQLKWLEQAGFINIEVHFMQAGHALFSGWKSKGR
jgi:tRNA (cmo5U34)-methyltransferase